MLPGSCSFNPFYELLAFSCISSLIFHWMLFEKLSLIMLTHYQDPAAILTDFSQKKGRRKSWQIEAGYCTLTYVKILIYE